MIQKTNRLLSLDVLRGLTVAGMVLVNNGMGRSFEPLRHAQWNGLTPCDLVFPFFLFMVGVSIYLSLSRHAGEPGIVWKVVKRTLIMFAIGVALHAFDMIVWGGAADIPGHLRIWGVLQRIALSYCAAALFFNCFKGKYLWRTIIGLLALYAVILIMGNGYSEDPAQNWLARVDKALFGNHLYYKALNGRTPVDPEGLVGTLSGIAHALLGVACGRALKQGATMSEHIMRLLIIAVSIGLVGWLISFGLPINKRIWSPSYALVTCGMAAGLLGVFVYLIDMKGAQQGCTCLGGARWYTVFEWFGVNALFIYVLSEMLSPVFGALGISSLIAEGYVELFGHGNESWASLAYALTFDAMMALCAWVLYKKKIYIKI